MMYITIKDEAIAPVIAFLLILTIVVSFFTIINAYYIPSLKQQSEIEHIRNVENKFLDIASDISQVLSFDKDVSIKERVELGGGDVLLSPVRSSGSLKISKEEKYVTITINYVDAPESTIYVVPVNISYNSTGNYWVEQNYQWDKGIVSILKSSRRAWLDYNDDSSASNETDQFINQMLKINDIILYPDDGLGIYLHYANISTCNMSIYRDKSFINGNGWGTVNLTSNVINNPAKIINFIRFDINNKITNSQKEVLNKDLESWWGTSSNPKYDNIIINDDVNSKNITFDSSLVDYNIGIGLQEKVIEFSAS